MRFDLESYAAWRRDHPNDPLHRDVESWMALEIERLRGENAVLIQTSADHCLACGWRFFVPGDGCQGCLVEQLRKDTKRYVAEERAAVVAWLREHWSEVLEQTPQQTARLIERGEHRREEER